MNQFIACCGLDCETCDARIATLTNNNTLREKTAALWTKLNGATISPEMIHCTGCRIEGVKTPFCDKFCSVHNCVREKGLDTCADCTQMDVCQELGRIASNNPSAMENLKQLRRSKQAEEAAVENVAGMTLLNEFTDDEGEQTVVYGISREEWQNQKISKEIVK